jgi:DNA topoisomerase II
MEIKKLKFDFYLNIIQVIILLMSTKKIEDKYVKLDPIEHVLRRPNMYVGSIEEDEYLTWIFDDKTQKMKKSKLKYVPGFYKIYDELIVNILDHMKRIEMSKSKNPVKTIKVNIDTTENKIEVYNDGDGIDIEIHPEHKVYIPELIFGNMLTSTNYDEGEEKIIGGMNGIGAKACNIFSKKFIIETVDANKGLKYTQEFENNMSKKNKPKIKKFSKYPYTKITFYPDLSKFNLKKITNPMYKMMQKRVYDVCALTNDNIKVFFNDEKLNIKNFQKYAELYFTDVSSKDILYEKINDRWEVIVSYTENSNLEQVSFVNGIWTLKGGKHVDYVVNQITKNMIEIIQKKNKEVNVKPQHIKDNLFVLIKSTIVNPAFDSQTKETLTTPVSKFGSKGELSKQYFNKLYGTKLIENVIELSQMYMNKSLKKTDGKKKNQIKGIPKLDDAIWAGTKKSDECTLILTEGDSAKSMAIAGLSVVGREKYGVFPLRGKLLNVLDTAANKIANNEEITNIKKIMGLETKKAYKDVKPLRYGKIMVMTDQDVDGSHIKGLLFNLFNTMWPSLIKIDGFMNSMLTPIIKAKKKDVIVEFYNLTDYDNWKKNNNVSKWDIKYYKGLGTSTEKEAKDYFKNIRNVEYIFDEDESKEKIDMAFNKKRADDRKEWLYNYDKQNVIDYKETKVDYEDFIDKDLIHFSVYDTGRSLPSFCDGLKISTRKILYSCFKRNLTKEIRVAQLAGYVSENANYHHGEKSLQDAITGMAQTYIGSNNINLLMPNGQFGSRLMGGKDSASPRYIHTQLNPLTFSIFNKEDLPILNYLKDDGDKIEPEFYLPVIPMILINGVIGIGTGFSCNIPCYNPKDLINIYKKLLTSDDINKTFKGLTEIEPHYTGHKGPIIKEDSKYISKGIFKRISPNQIEITELPIGTWTQDFKEFLEKYMEKNPKILKEYESHYTESTIKFILHFEAGSVNNLLKIDKDGVHTKFEKDFKLITSKMLSTTNMHMFNEEGTITKMKNTKQIIKEFYNFRLSWYQKRKDYLIDKLKNDLVFLDARIKFILDIIEDRLKVNNKKKEIIEEYLEKNNYPKKKIESDDKSKTNYDYLIRMPIWNLTYEKKEELLKELNNKKDMLSNIQKKKIENMWLEDLEAFEKDYEKYITHRLNELEDKPIKKRSKVKV